MGSTESKTASNLDHRYDVSEPREDFKPNKLAEDASLASQTLEFVREFFKPDLRDLIKLGFNDANVDKNLISLRPAGADEESGSKKANDKKPTSKTQTPDENIDEKLEHAKKYLDQHPPNDGKPNYLDLLKDHKDARLIIATDLTHGSPDRPKELEELIKQLTNPGDSGQPPLQVLGLEGIKQEYQPIIKAFLESKDKSSEEQKKARDELEKVIRGASEGFLGGQDPQNWVNAMMTVMDLAREKGLQVLGIEPNVRGVWEKSGTSHGLTVEGLKTLLGDKSMNGADVLKRYMSGDGDARQELLVFFRKNSEHLKLDSEEKIQQMVGMLDDMKKQNFDFNKFADVYNGLVDKDSRDGTDRLFSLVTEWRNLEIKPVLDAWLNDPKNKDGRMLLSIGSGHIGEGEYGTKTLNDIMDQKQVNLRSGSWKETNPDTMQIRPEDREKMLNILLWSYAAHNAGKEGRFWFRIPSNIPEYYVEL